MYMQPHTPAHPRIHMHPYTCTIYMHPRIHAPTHTCTHTYMHPHVRVNARTHARVYTHMHTHTSTRKDTHAHCTHMHNTAHKCTQKKVRQPSQSASGIAMSMLLAFLGCALLSQADGLTFVLEPRAGDSHGRLTRDHSRSEPVVFHDAVQCFYEETVKGTNISGSFAVSSGGALDVDFKVVFSRSFG